MESTNNPDTIAASKGFSCEQTIPWERTLDNPMSFTFRKFISLQEISNTDFPEHYFNFAAYNELPAKVNVRNPVLTVMLTKTPSPALSRTASNQFDPQLNITSSSQQSPTRLRQPEDRMRSQQEKEPVDLPQLSTDMSTHIQVLQSTPPQIENPTEAHKGSKPSNPTTPSARKALFKDTSEIESPQVPKKQSTTSKKDQDHADDTLQVKPVEINFLHYKLMVTL
uniref:DNA helicase n=1 Tax=Tanacetum cinerariifolium TaxID=118510 RepID=A0A6L2NS65_TANCI|nr:DNA helicase [Tanacetum cinerariifolium]